MQFSIRKGTCASFTELDIRFRVQLAFTPEAKRVSGTFPDVFAPFENDRFESALCKIRAAKSPPWPAADNNGAGERFVWRVSDEFVFHVRRFADMRMAVKTLEQGGFIRDFCIDRIGKDNRGFFAGIVIPAINGKAVQFFFSNGKAVKE